MRAWLVCALLVAAALLPWTASAADLDGDGMDEVQEDALLQQYAPVLSFHPQESYFPTTIDFALQNSVLERYTGGTPLLIDSTPTGAELAAYSTLADPFTNPQDIYYLNNTDGGPASPAGILAAWQAANGPKAVYGHVVPDGGNVVVQYWFFYAFNPGSWNNHEGDWETIEVVLNGGTPQGVGYSQHESGEKMTWAEVDKEGTHPKVYVARGSHSNYLRSYEGRIGIAGDAVSDGGAVWRSTDYSVTNVGEVSAPLPGSEWLAFAGRWGEFDVFFEEQGENGPGGPAFREDGRIFSSPVAWANGLEAPNGDLLLVSWFLANLFLIFILLVLLFFSIKIALLYRLQKKTKVGIKMWPYAHLRPFDKKSAGMVLAVVGLIVGIVGFLLPWYQVTANVDVPGFLNTNGPVDLMKFDGLDGLTINPLKRDGSLSHVGLLPVPIGLMLLITSSYFFLKMAGTKTSRRLGVRFLLKGIVALLPFILVLIIAAVVFPSFSGGGNPDPRDPTAVFSEIGRSPFGGSTSIDTGGNGSVQLSWGLGLGAWLLIASAVILFIAAGLCLGQRYSFLPQWYVDGHKSPEEAAAKSPTAVYGVNGATSVYPPMASSSSDSDPRLTELQSLRDLGLISATEYEAKKTGVLAASVPPAPPEDDPRLRQLDDLRSKGLISDAEYQAKAAALSPPADTGVPGPMLVVATTPGGTWVPEPPPPTAAAPPPPPPPTTTRACRSCGAPIESVNRFCPVCGTAS